MEAVQREERMPERMAIPSVPRDVCQRESDSRVLVVLTASKDRESHGIRAVAVIECAIGNAQSCRHLGRDNRTVLQSTGRF